MSDPQQLVLAAGVLLCAYLIRGVSGFGSALFAVPLLAHLYPLTVVVPLMASLDLIGSLLLSHHGWRGRQIDWQEIRRLLPSALLGIVLGLLLLHHAPERPLLILLGLVVIGFGLRAALGVGDDRPIGPGWAHPAGLAGGTVDALFATGGPPFVIYLAHRIRDKGRLRATLSMLFLIEGGLRVAGFALLGLLWSPQLALALLGGLPLLLLGLHLGHRIHLGISQAQLATAIGLLLVASGGSILVRGLA